MELMSNHKHGKRRYMITILKLQLNMNKLNWHKTNIIEKLLIYLCRAEMKKFSSPGCHETDLP